MSAVLALCARWDALSKGETETTRAIRAAYAEDTAQCGQRAVVAPSGAPDPAGYQTGSCIEIKGHGPQHCDADGYTWTESVR